MRRPTMIAVLLAARAAAGVALALWVRQARPDWSRAFEGIAGYAAADGGIALLIAVRLFCHRELAIPRSLALATAADGVVRVSAGSALGLFPGIPGFPVTAVIFLGTLGVWAGCLAVIAMVVRLRAIRRGHARPDDHVVQVHEELDPVFIVGAVALAVDVYALVAGPPATADALRTALARWTLFLAAAFLIAAAGAWPARRRVERQLAEQRASR